MRLKKRVKKIFQIPNDPDKGWVEIKHLKVHEVRKVESRVNDISYSSKKDGEGETKISLNPYPRVTAFAHECLVNWGNMFDVMDRPLAFKDSNIEQAAEFEVEVDGEVFDFYTWVDKCREKLAEEVAIKEKEAVVN